MKFDLTLHDLEEDPAAFTIARQMFEWARAEGAIPAWRKPLAGTEMAFLATCPELSGVRTAIGCAVFYQPDDHDMLFLDVLYVAQPFRRAGVGRALVDAVYAEALNAEGIGRMEFGTGVENAAMQALGARCGFRTVAVFMQRLAGGEKLQ